MKLYTYEKYIQATEKEVKKHIYYIDSTLGGFFKSFKISSINNSWVKLKYTTEYIHTETRKGVYNFLDPIYWGIENDYRKKI